MSDGISPNKLNDLSKVYLDQINTFREIKKGLISKFKTLQHYSTFTDFARFLG